MPNTDFDALLNILLPYAQEQVSKHGKFSPIGASVKNDGSVTLAGGTTEDASPLKKELVRIIEKGFVELALKGEVQAVGLCIDARVVPPGKYEKTDAICCSLEHKNGEAVNVFLPYKIGFLKRVKYGELFANIGKQTTFTASSTT